MKKDAAVALIEQVSQQLAISQQHLSQGEREVLLLALQDVPPSQMAKRLGDVKAAAIRKRLGEIYSKFNIEGRGPGKFAKLMQMLRSIPANPQGNDLALSHFGDLSLEPLGDAEALKTDNAAANQQFVGREVEQQDLKRWVFQEACRVAAIWGMAGIGKTTLASKCLWDWGTESLLDSTNREYAFSNCVGISLAEGKTCQACISEILHKLKAPQQRLTSQTDSTQGDIKVAISNLLTLLRDHRYLIVLDGYEGVFGTKELGKYDQAYKDYDGLLRQLMTHPHQSCILLTSREKPRSLGVEQAMNVRILQLKGLSDDAAQTLLEKKEAFQTKPLPRKPDERPDESNLDDTGSRENLRQQLVERYNGNPLWLKVAATTISESFDGNIANFFARGKLIYDEQKSVLKPLFKRLNLAQQEVLGWLAINQQQPVTLETLQDDIFDGTRRRDLVYTLRSLERCDLVKSAGHSSSQYALQPVVQEFVTNRLVTFIVEELISPETSRTESSQPRDSNREKDCFNRYCLVKANSEEYIQQLQRHKFLKPVYDKLLSSTGSLTQLTRMLQQRLQQRQKQEQGQAGYFAGNMMSLFGELQRASDPMVNQSTRIDFSRLPIWQASFKELQPEQFIFESCDINRSDFLENLGDVFALAFNHPPSSFHSGEAHQIGPSLLAAGDSNGRVHLWQLPECNKLADWQGHQSWVRCIAFSKDGRWLATGGDDNCLRLWELKSKLHSPLVIESQSYSSPALTYEEELGDWVRAMAFSEESDYIVCSSGSRVAIRTIERRSRLSKVTRWHSFPHLVPAKREQECQNICVRAIALSKDGRWLATGGDDHLIQIWDFAQLSQEASLTEEPKPCATLRKHRGWIRALVFSPEGDRLISSSDDGTVQIWNINPSAKGYQFSNAGPSLKDHCERVRSLAISQDGDLLASGGDDCQVRLWDLDRNASQELRDPTTALSKGRIWAVALSQRNGCPLLAYGDDAQTIRLQELTPQLPAPHGQSPKLQTKLLKTIQGYTSSTRTALFIPNLKTAEGLPLIVSGGDNHQIQVWKNQAAPAAKPLRPLATLSGHQGRIWQLAYHPETKILASASDDQTVRLWNIATQDCLGVLTGHTYWVRTLSFAPSGLLLASAGDDETIRLWDVRSGFCLSKLGQSRQGAKLSATVFTNAVSPPPIGHHHWIRSVAFSLDSKTLASGGDGKQVLLWDVAEAAEHRDSDQIPQRLGPLQNHRIRAIAFSPNGDWLASSNDNGDIWIWRYPDAVSLGHEASPARQLKHWKWGVKAIAFSPCSRYLATVGDDQTIYFWEMDSDSTDPVKTLLPPASYGSGRGFRSVAFSADGQYLVTGDREAWIEVWQLYDSSAPEQLNPHHLNRFTPPRPYDGMNITHVTGIDAVRRSSLKALGAVENSVLFS